MFHFFKYKSFWEFFGKNFVIFQALAQNMAQVAAYATAGAKQAKDTYKQ